MVPAKKHAHLVLKAPPLVVRPLTVDVPQQHPGISRAHGEQPISALPREIRYTLLFHPRRRTRLQLRHDLRRRPRHRQPHRKVHMVFHSTHAKTLALQPPSRPRKVRMQLGSNLLTNQRHTAFRTEHNVHQIEAERLRHAQKRTSPSLTRPSHQGSPLTTNPFRRGIPTNPSDHAYPHTLPARRAHIRLRQDRAPKARNTTA